jgi:xylulokinase
VYRAILESLAFEQRFLTTGAEEALDEKVSRIIALGGGSRSRIWCQIVADVLQRRVEVVREPESNLPRFGCARGGRPSESTRPSRRPLQR